MVPKIGKVVAISGGFDPPHDGHLDLIEGAKELAGSTGEVVIIANNENWLRKKGEESGKKRCVFYPDKTRVRLLSAIVGSAGRVVLTSHSSDDPDMSVCRELRAVRPDIFANGGDRAPNDKPVPEVALCRELGIEMAYNVGGGKVDSSSDLVRQASDAIKTFYRPWGFYQVHASPEGRLWTLKTLHLNPLVQLSVQLHRKRSEYWTLVQGSAEAGIGNPPQWEELKPFCSFFVPRQSIHTLRSGAEGAVVVEVMEGEYDENDIERLGDLYGRT